MSKPKIVQLRLKKSKRLPTDPSIVLEVSGEPIEWSSSQLKVQKSGSLDAGHSFDLYFSPRQTCND